MVKDKKCKVCSYKFIPRNTTQVVCSPNCALKLSKQKAIKDWDKVTRKRKLKIKTRLKWLSEAQTVFNSYIRQRDQKLPCISCGIPNNGKHQRHASHYRSIGSSSHLRFCLNNVHASCMKCNSHLSGNITDYRVGLIKKIGIEKVEGLEVNNFIAKHDIEYAKRIKSIFKEKLKRITK